MGPVGDAVLAERDGERAERRRLDDVDADLEERVVHLGDEVGPGSTSISLQPSRSGPPKSSAVRPCSCM